MFDFLKDIYDEINQFDDSKIQQHKEKKKNKKKLFLINGTTRIVTTIVAVLYIIMSGVNISILIKTGINLRIIKYISLSILAITIIVTLRFKKKSVDRVSIFLIGIFIGLNFITL